MTHLDRQVRSAQRRLWLNRWTQALCLCLAVAFGVAALILLVQRSWALSLPVTLIGIGLVGLAMMASAGWVLWTRDGAEIAAARLDQAAGLRERLSSGRYCRTQDDPFARAVVWDAERLAASITATRHLRLTSPRHWPWTLSTGVLAALMFLVPRGWLQPVAEARADRQAVQIEQTRKELARELEPLQRLAEANPVLEEYREQLEDLNKEPGARLRRPEDLRHEAVKKIDSLSDVMRQRRENEKFAAVGELRKMLRRVAPPRPDESPTDKLAQALARGDFKAAKEEIERAKEQLATLKADEDQESLKKLSERLEQLARKIEQAANDDRLAEELRKSGLTKEESERILESLAKKDLDQLQRELAEKGLDEQQIEKLARQIKRQQQAGEMAKQLAQKMGQASQAAAQGDAADAASELSQTGDQLSNLELLEQEMAQLESAMAALDGAKGQIGQGRGEGEEGQGWGDHVQPGRGGMGKTGQGRGGLARQELTDIEFKTERGKVHTGRGAIAGQFLIDGAQVPGEVGTSVAEMVTAAQRDASDRIERDRIPRQYQKAVKAYFSNVQRSVKELKPKTADAVEPAASTGESTPAPDEP